MQNPCGITCPYNNTGLIRVCDHSCNKNYMYRDTDEYDINKNTSAYVPFPPSSAPKIVLTIDNAAYHDYLRRSNQLQMFRQWFNTISKAAVLEQLHTCRGLEIVFVEGYEKNPYWEIIKTHIDFVKGVFI